MRFDIKTISKKLNIFRIHLYKSFLSYDQIGHANVSYKNNIGNIFNIHIKSTHRKQGYGSKLLQYSEDILKQKNKDLSHIRLTAYDTANGTLTSFYNKNGYKCEFSNCEYNYYDDGLNLNHVTSMIKQI